jgi:hypothetical protein
MGGKGFLSSPSANSSSYSSNYPYLSELGLQGNEFKSGIMKQTAALLEISDLF